MSTPQDPQDPPYRMPGQPFPLPDPDAPPDPDEDEPKPVPLPSMTANEYERQYSEALAELRSRGCTVASPYTAPDGIRRVQIDNLQCVDLLVFEKAWGKKIAEQMRMEVMTRDPRADPSLLP
jgi:hypothetical protein